jgi:uncharacterized membrane protein YkvA (DUF1232 family)
MAAQNGHAKHYSEKDFWKKVADVAQSAGKTVIESALTLYNVLQDKDTPLAAKGIIIGALGYFILPFDVIPDFLPGGFVDDLAVLGAALSAVAVSVKDSHREAAAEKVKKWFGGKKAKAARPSSKAKARKPKSKRAR